LSQEVPSPSSEKVSFKNRKRIVLGFLFYVQWMREMFGRISIIGLASNKVTN